MTGLAEVKDVLDDIAKAHKGFAKSQTEKLDNITAEQAALRDRIEELESRRGAPGKHPVVDGKQKPEYETWVDRKSGAAVPVLDHKQQLSSIHPNTTGVTPGRWLRSVLVGRHNDDKNELSDELKALATTPDASGGYTVPQPLAAEFIDLLRAQSVLSRAGVRTVPMPSKTLSIAKIIADATVAWRAENASISASDPTFGAVDLSAKTIVGLVKFSLELSQDSLNVEQAITRSLTGAMAAEIDRAGLQGDGTSNSPTGVLNYNGRERVVGIGGVTSYDPFVTAVGQLMSKGVLLEDIGPFIIGTELWADLARLKTGISSDNSPLPKPPALTMPFLPTTSVQSTQDSPSTSTAFVGDWRDLLWGVRSDITVRVLTEAFLGSNLQLAVLVYARCDFAAARESSLCSLEGITH